jgi:CRP-like cAMP-binding protein
METIDVLASSSLFTGVSHAALTAMAAGLVVQSWPRHCQIGAHGQPDRFHVIVSGRVKISRSNEQNGRELTLWLLGPGDGFDIVSLLDGAPHAVSAWTLDEVQTLSAPVALVGTWIDRYPAFRLSLLRYVAGQLRKLTDLASDLALHDTMTRLAHLLLRHSDPGASADSRGLQLLHSLPQEELASLIGSVRVVISRLLAELKRDAVIEFRSGAVHIADLKRLMLRAQTQLASTLVRPMRDRASKG